MRLTYDPRYDTVGHWPKPIDPVPCMHCKGETNISCTKCEVALCCNERRNCYILYHTDTKGKIICTPEFVPPVVFVPYEDSSTSERELSSDSDPESNLDHSESDFSGIKIDNCDPESTQPSCS